MKIYKVTLLFNNLDNSLYTDHQATVLVEIKSDTEDHAHLLACKLRDVYDADDYELK